MSAGMSPSTGWSLRPATTDDLPKILEIEKRVHVAPWDGAGFEGELAKPYCRFLLMTDDETDSEIAGYVVFWTMFDECQLLNIAVDLPHRGLGFAKQMIRHLVNVASQKNAKRVILDVRKSNAAAIGLYQALGFSISHVRKAFYSDGEEAYQMTLEMTGERVEF
jgi:ribosomal-protein-alanine N-acetyltransferase